MNEQDPSIEHSTTDDEVILAQLSDTPSAEKATTPVKTRVPLKAPRRKVMLPTLLFLATCCSAFLVGISHWLPSPLLPHAMSGNLMPLRIAVLTNGFDGLIYMAAMIGILLTHEMGHFLMTLRYRVPSTLPFFIPIPLPPFGTMGAVIAMDGRRADRKEIFDIGIAGPLAGLVIAIPVLILGVAQADFTVPGSGGMQFHIPIFIEWLMNLTQPQGYQNQSVLWVSQMNPLLMAGWFGLLVTGLNMVPVGQLDGGHVIYTLFGEKGRWIARAFVMMAIAYITITGTYMWAPMLMLVILLVGVDHPPTSDDNVPLGPVRFSLGLASLAIPILSLPPGGISW